MKNSVFRASFVSFLLWLACDFKSAFLGAAAATMYDIATDRTVQLSWRIALQIAKQRMAAPPPASTAHCAKKTMRKPMKMPPLHINTSSPSSSEDKADGPDIQNVDEL